MLSISSRSVTFSLIFRKWFLLEIPQDNTYEVTLKWFCKVADGDELRLSNHLIESIIAKSGVSMSRKL